MNKKGIAAWGLSLPFWMKASWFKKHGFKKVDKNTENQIENGNAPENSLGDKLINPEKNIEE